ncbi:MAG TPA: sugar ABC transporter permease [Candidatus Limnocylindrales bacterium]|nr:sugar ABC transporter permease [Candidatus Limnocylindrales bacterium]
MDPRLPTAIIVVVGIPAVLVGYILATEQVLRAFPERLKPRIRPWLWLAPALAFLIFYLIYPTIGTVISSFQDQFGKNWVGLANYAWFFSADDGIGSLVNNIIWLVLLTAITVGVGLLIAVLVDRVRYESFAKSVIFLPLAISATAASVIWLYMFAYQPPGHAQTGTLNAIVTALGAAPIAFMPTSEFKFNTVMLIIVTAWVWTGFAMVIISAALKGISTELLEAARVDGANEWQVFRNIIFPLLLPTLTVVATVMIITALKAFDIVYVMTNGNFDTQVIANAMYTWMFTNGNFGRGSVLAIILMLTVIPVMIFNINRFRAQEAIR